jgi:DNA-binding NarL/FixJ family response regulator
MIKILLVDDQNLVREGIKALLQLTPQMSVIAEACDGDEALTALEQYSPDIMLLDLRMPKRDGLSVLEAMQQKNINVPTLILTTFDEHDLVLNCLKLGAMGYLKKDVSLNDLVCAIESLAKGIPWVKPAHSDKK